MTIVGVQFESKYREGEFYGREYSYFVAEGINLKPGDVVNVPTSEGPRTARVSNDNVPESQVDERILPHLKTITGRPFRKSLPDTGQINMFETEVPS